MGTRIKFPSSTYTVDARRQLFICFRDETCTPTAERPNYAFES